MDRQWECVVVGAGAAGLSAALVLGRARRRTLVIDAGGQSNMAAHGIGGLLGHDTRAPADFYSAGRAEVLAHPSVKLRLGTVVDGGSGPDGFVLELADGSRETARRVLLATGMRYLYPALEGLEERWGRTVFHCPFCHGWEVRGQALGVLDRGDAGVQRALLLRAWSEDVTLLTNGSAGLSETAAEQARSAAVQIDERPVAGLEGPDGTLTAVRFADGTERPLGGLLVPVTLQQRDDLVSRLGAAVAEAGPLSAETVAVDPQLFTSVPGVAAAGDVSGQMPSVANAIAAGSNAAAAIVHSLLSEPPATPARDDGASPSVAFWEHHYQDRTRPPSGHPGAVLAEIATPLRPGTALDLGCGLGDDALWLAARGWRVTGVDVSATAVRSASVRAEEAGVARAADFQQHDLTHRFPAGTFDLVSAQYLQSPVEFDRTRVLQRAAQAVAPGGLLLIVSHAAVSPWSWNADPDTRFPTPEESFAELALEPHEWRVESLGTPERDATGPDGQAARVRDSVIALRRRAPSTAPAIATDAHA